MPLNTILAQVRTLVGAAAGIGTDRVHDGIRFANDETTFRALFRDAAGSRLHGWMVSYAGADEDLDGLNNLSIRTYEIRVVGLYSVDDATTGTAMTSELEFRPIVEAVCTQIRQNYTLGGTAMLASPPRIVAFDHRMFHRVLVHLAEIRFEAQERLQYTGA